MKWDKTFKIDLDKSMTFLDPSTPEGQRFHEAVQEALRQLKNGEGPWAKIVNPVQICKACKLKNEFATPNQPDGSYICYECR